MNDYKMSSQKSGAQKRKEKQKRDEINKKGRQTLFQFGVKCKTSETNQNETLNLEQCETSAELKKGQNLMRPVWIFKKHQIK